MRFLKLSFTLFGSATLVTVAILPKASAEAKQPNIIFLLSDDQHWNETSVQMHPDLAGSKNSDYPTPHLEELASQGMRFSAAYAPAPVCSSTRASILTGLSPAKLRWCKVGPPVNAESGNFKLITPSSRRSLEGEVGFASYLQKAGYATAHYGKWHIGGGGPEKNGFDASDGDIGNEAAAKFKDTNPVDIVGMTERAKSFIDTQVKSKKPFYIQMSYLALHSPGNASQKNIAKFFKLHPDMRTRDIQRIALTADLDEGVGALLEHLDRQKIADHTYVIYMSDNGAVGKNDQLLKGGKGSVHEGGTRAVFIVRGPSVPTNSWSAERIVGFDLFPTFCKLAGVTEPLPEGLEGGELADVFHGGKQPVKRALEGIMFHFPHYQSATPMTALYHENYKLLRNYESGTAQLFDIDTDLAETKDLSTKQPEKLKAMQQLLDKHLLAAKADLPKANPNYDPTKPTATLKRGRKGGRKSR